MNNSKVSFLHLFFIVALLTHGAAYFLTGDIYNKENPVKLIKYIVSILYISSIVFFVNRMHKLKVRLICVWLFFLNLLLLYALVCSLQIDYIVFLLIPFLYIFISVKVNLLYLSRVYQIVLILAFIFMILEFLFFFDISTRFNRSGFRSISIFVNPNAFGATVVLLFLTVLFYIKNRLLTFLNMILSLAMVLLSGSKTALVAISIVILSIGVRSLLNNRIYFIPLIFAAISLYPIITIMDSHSGNSYEIQMRTLDLASGGERLKAFSEFSVAADECLFLPVNCNELIYVDNAFISSWIYLGVPGLFITLGVFISSIVFAIKFALISSNYYFICFFSLFWLMAMSTNLMNIWPTAYLFWITYGYMLNFNIKRTSNA